MHSVRSYGVLQIVGDPDVVSCGGTSVARPIRLSIVRSVIDEHVQRQGCKAIRDSFTALSLDVTGVP